MMRVILTAVCAVILGWSGDARAEVDPDREYLERLEEAAVRAEKARSHLDRSQLDLGALLDDLDDDPEAIVGFVRSRIAFEQYAGLLRGARGTLQSRAGNALDQAILLATLLRDAGFDARIHRGRLAPGQADRLLGLMAPPRAAPPPGDLESIEAALRVDRATGDAGIGSTPEAGPTWQEPTTDAVTEAVETLLAALDSSGIELGDPGLLEELREEARDYFWVESRQDPTAGWTPVHPVFADANAEFEDLVATQTLAGEVPSELQHRLRFQAFIEQKIGDRLEVHPIMDPWERPVANFLHHEVAFANYPSGLSDETLARGWDEVLASSSLFIPAIGGSLAPGAMAFDRNGVLFDLEAKGMDTFGATALFQEVGSKFEKAGGALRGLGAKEPQAPPDDLMALTAQWVEYTYIGPDGDEVSYRRMIMDRLGSVAREHGDLSQLRPESEYRQLLSNHTFQMATGRQPVAQLVDALLAGAAGRSEVLAQLTETAGEDLSPLSVATVLGKARVAAPQLYLFGIFDREALAAAELLYRSEPAIVALQTGLDAAGGQYAHGDIIQSSWRAFSFAKDGLQAVPTAVMHQGVWETATEDFLLGPSAWAERNRAATRRTARPAAAAGSPAALRPGDRLPQEAMAAVEPEARPHLLGDLRSGYAAVLPTSPSLTRLNPVTAWWRVDPHTGETLGIGPDGRGGSIITEYNIDLIAAAIAGAVLGCLAIDCTTITTDCLRARNPRCCMDVVMQEQEQWLQQSLPGSVLVGFSRAIQALADHQRDPSCFH